MSYLNSNKNIVYHVILSMKIINFQGIQIINLVFIKGTKCSVIATIFNPFLKALATLWSAFEFTQSAP
jgi:hypothetical protein